MRVFRTAWPGAQRRDPPATSATWVVRLALARWLRGRPSALARAGTRSAILDVGCGPKPYYPFFADVAAEYVGLDVVPTPSADAGRGRRGHARRVGPLRPRPLHAGARALRRPGPRRLRAAAGDRSRRPRARLDPRRSGLPPFAARLLAVDARGSLRKLFRDNADWAEPRVAPAAGRPRRSRCCARPSSRSARDAREVPALARGPVWALNRGGRRARSPRRLCSVTRSRER